jgi:hypothetical protein
MKKHNVHKNSQECDETERVKFSHAFPSKSEAELSRTETFRAHWVQIRKRFLSAIRLSLARHRGSPSQSAQTGDRSRVKLPPQTFLLHTNESDRKLSRHRKGELKGGNRRVVPNTDVRPCGHFSINCLTESDLLQRSPSVMSILSC